MSDKSLIVEEKFDGTNVGVHFSDAGEMFLQCRGHLVIVMRHDLKMRRGKQIAQSAHASISFICRRLQDQGSVSLETSPKSSGRG